MDCESRDVLMPEVREKISDRISAKELGGEMMPELKKVADGGYGISWELLHAAWMCRWSIEAASSKIRFSEVASSMLLQLLLLYPYLMTVTAS